MTTRSFAPGEVIYREGDECDSAFMVLSGEVEISHNGHRHTAVKGDIFGELSLLAEEPHRETATAKSSVRVQIMAESTMLPNTASSTSSDPGTSHDTTGNAKLTQELGRVILALEKRCDDLEQKLQYMAPAQNSAAGADQRPEALSEELITHLSDLGPIMPLLEDDTVNDILINGTRHIYVERNGMLYKTDIKFPNYSEVLTIAEKIVKAVGRRIDYRRPLVDARLLDGSRVNIIAPPLAVDGTMISIRKFSKKKLTLDIMAQQNNMSKPLAEFLKIVGKSRLNVLVSGGTGSGKTTLLNAVSQYIDPAERVVTVEDAAELQLNQPHVIRLETKPHQPGGNHEEDVTIRDLVKNALRMRPDRIIVGEVRGPEAFDMMQAMNTGHEGSLTTVHANHPRDALSRLENMVSMANLQIPMKSLRYQLASALHLIIQVSRMRDGLRRVTHVSEVVGMEGDMVTMHDLFNYVIEGEDEKGQTRGQFKWSGIMPRFVRRVAYYGELQRLEEALGVKLPKTF